MEKKFPRVILLQARITDFFEVFTFLNFDLLIILLISCLVAWPNKNLICNVAKVTIVNILFV